MLRIHRLKIKSKAQHMLCFAVFCLFGFLGYGQQNVLDSLNSQLKKTEADSVKIMLMLQIAKQHIYSDISESTKFAEGALALAKKKNLKEAEGKVYDFIGIIHSIQGEYKEGIHYFKLAADVFKQINLESSFAKSYGNIATNYQFLEDFEKSLEAQLISLQISERLKDSVAMSASYINLGALHHKLNNIDRAEKYYRKAFQLSVKINQPERVVEATSNLSLVFLLQKQTDSAIYYVNYSIELAKKENLTYLMYNAIEVLGTIYLENNNFELAKQKFLQTKPEFEKINYEYHVISNYVHLAESYAGLQKTDSATYYYHKALKTGLQSNYQIHNLDIYKGLTKLFIRTNEKDSALYYFEKSLATKDELVNAEKTKITERFQAEFETQKKEKEITLLKEQNKLKDVRIEKRTYFIATLFLIVILILTGGFFIQRHTRLKQQKKSAELEHKAFRAQMNPHFIFNALNSIQRIYVEGNIKRANDFMADFAQLMRRILENSDSSKIPLDKEIETLCLYMDLEKLRCKDCFQYHITIDENIPASLKIPPLLIQPFIENSIWHGIIHLQNQEGIIDIQITDVDEDNIQVVIKDNGVGFDPEKQQESKHSKGIAITKERIDGDLIIESVVNKGTTVTFKLRK